MYRLGSDEDLISIRKKLSIEDKEVRTVLQSGDWLGFAGKVSLFLNFSVSSFVIERYAR
jgi:hypothetical protein